MKKQLVPFALAAALTATFSNVASADVTAVMTVDHDTRRSKEMNQEDSFFIDSDLGTEENCKNIARLHATSSPYSQIIASCIVNDDKGTTVNHYKCDYFTCVKNNPRP